MKAAYREYKKCRAELKSLDMDEEQKNREMAFLEFEINEIEKASLVPGEDEELEKQYRKLSNGRRIIDSYKVPMPLPDMMDRERGSSGRGSSGAFQSDRVR